MTTTHSLWVKHLLFIGTCIMLALVAGNSANANEPNTNTLDAWIIAPTQSFATLTTEYYSNKPQARHVAYHPNPVPTYLQMDNQLSTNDITTSVAININHSEKSGWLVTPYAETDDSRRSRNRIIGLSFTKTW